MPLLSRLPWVTSTHRQRRAVGQDENPDFQSPELEPRVYSQETIIERSPRGAQDDEPKAPGTEVLQLKLLALAMRKASMSKHYRAASEVQSHAGSVPKRHIDVQPRVQLDVQGAVEAGCAATS